VVDQDFRAKLCLVVRRTGSAGHNALHPIPTKSGLIVTGLRGEQHAFIRCFRPTARRHLTLFSKDSSRQNQCNALPVLLDTETSIGANTNWRGSAGCTLARSAAYNFETVLLAEFATQIFAPSKATPTGPVPTAKVPSIMPSLARSLVTLLLS
jgi:hypothetical protein